MKYVIWICAFIAYVLVFVGIFTLLGNTTKGLLVEIDVERVVYGETIIRQQEVEFNDVPAVKWIFGMSGLLITISGGFAVANSLVKTWGSGEEIKSTKTEKIIRVGIFSIFFFAFSFILKVHTIFEIFDLTGIIFMIVVCAGTNIVSNLLIKMAGKRKDTAVERNGGVAI